MTTPPYRFLVVIMIPPPLSSQFLNLQNQYGPPQWPRRIGPHITLIPPFEATQPAVLQYWHDFKPATLSFPVRLDGFDHFSSRVVFARIKPDPSLLQLHRELSTHFRPLLPPDHDYHPHVTVANKLTPTQYQSVWSSLRALELQAAFDCRSITLARYDTEAGQWQPAAQKGLTHADPPQATA